MDIWHSIEDICKLLNVSRPTVTRLIKENRLLAINIGKGKRPTWKIHDSHYKKFVAESYQHQIDTNYEDK